MSFSGRSARIISRSNDSNHLLVDMTCIMENFLVVPKLIQTRTWFRGVNMTIELPVICPSSSAVREGLGGTIILRKHMFEPFE